MHELVYTSAPKGLKPGSQGFCTVACSAGMPPNLMTRLESLSGYRHHIQPGQPGQHTAGVNPVVRSHLVVRMGGVVWHVLSRISDAGIDYTQRANKIAHHIVLEPSELPAVGPAALLACENRFYRRWDDEPKLIMKPSPFPQVKSSPQICRTWESVTGDAGWGGVLADTARESRQVQLVVMPETDVLALFGESLALLSPDLRWQTTLTTWFTRFPSGLDCRWRCIVAGSPEMSQIGLTPDVMVIDLTQPLKTPVPTPLVKAARSGKAPTAFVNVANIAELSATMDAERASDDRGDGTSDSHTTDTTDTPVDTAPIAKQGKKPKKRKRAKPNRFAENHEQRSTNTKEQATWGLLLLIGLGLLFIGVPMLLIVALVLRNR